MKSFLLISCFLVAVAGQCTTALRDLPLCSTADVRVDPTTGCPNCRPECPLVDRCTATTTFSIDRTSGCPVCIPDCTTVTACATDVRPEFDPTTGCPTCKLECPRPPPCVDPETPTVNAAGCPSCHPECTETEFRALTECTADRVPELNKDTGCPSCRPPIVPCTRTGDCAAVRECNPDERPFLDTATCCPSCRIPFPCTPTQLETCRATGVAALTDCATGVRPSFDVATCCLTCKPVVPTDAADRPDATTGRCTSDAFRKCAAATATCEAGEEPVAFREMCCASCIRPEARCSLRDVVACERDIPVCGAGERPQRRLGSCCPTCRPPPPTCAAACAEDEVCRRTAAGAAPVCVAVSCRNFKIEADAAKAIVDARGLDLEDRTADDTDPAARRRRREAVRHLVREIVMRYCSKPENAADCEAAREEIDAVRARIFVRPDDSAVILRICVFDVNRPAGGRRLLGAGDVVDGAMADGDAQSGLTVSPDNGAGTSAPPEEKKTSGAAATAAVAITVAAAFAFLA